jgi:hypothetical protein
MGYSVVRIDEIEPAPNAEGREHDAMVAAGARRGSYEARGPF